MVGTGEIDPLTENSTVDLTENDISLMVFIKVEGGDNDNILADNVSLLLDDCNTLESHDVTGDSGELVGVGLL